MSSLHSEFPEGHEIRPPTPDDFPSIADLINLCSQEMIGEDMLSLTDVTNDLTCPGFEIEKDARIALSPDGEVVACADVWAITRPPVHPFIWGRVHPEHRGRGIGHHLLVWAVDRARHVLSKVPEDARVSAFASNLSTWEPSHLLLADHGFQVVRHSFEMKIELDGPPARPAWPDGITLCRYEHPDEAEEVCRASMDGFRDHFGHVDEPFEASLERFRHHCFKDEGFDPGLWFLAKDGDEIAGLCLNRRWDGTKRDIGHVASLAVRRPWRRRGIALALLLHSFEMFRERGRKAATLSVDAGSLTGAVRLYEKAGMHTFRRYDTYELELKPGREISTTEVDGGTV